MMITLDPGHGGTDPGAIGKQGTKEKDITLKIAMKLRDQLQSDKGARVSMTRTNDKDVYGPDATDAQELQGPCRCRPDERCGFIYQLTFAIPQPIQIQVV